MTTATDRELVFAANNGEEAALVELYRRHRDWVMAVALRIVGQEADALDVLQETFSYFFGKFPGFELTAPLRGFLFPVVRHNALSLIRRQRRVVPLDEQRALAAGRLVWHPPRVSELSKMVEALPEEQRQVVLLRFGMEMRLGEIAAALSIPLGTVKSRLHNALKALREEMIRQNDRSE